MKDLLLDATSRLEFFFTYDDNLSFQTESDSMEGYALNIWRDKDELVFLFIETCEDEDGQYDYDELAAKFKAEGLDSPEGYVMIGDDLTYNVKISRRSLTATELPSNWFFRQMDDEPDEDLKEELEESDWFDQLFV